MFHRQRRPWHCSTRLYVCIRLSRHSKENVVQAEIKQWLVNAGQVGVTVVRVPTMRGPQLAVPQIVQNNTLSLATFCFQPHKTKMEGIEVQMRQPLVSPVLTSVNGETTL